MHALPRTVLLTAALLAPAALASACGGAESAAPAAAATTAPPAGVTPPRPTGAAPVGFTRSTLTDAHRIERLAGETGPRQVPIRVWYPAATPAAEPAVVFTAAEQTVWEQGGALAPGALDGLGTAATAGAPAASGRHPVLLMSPGLGETTALMTAHASDLASHGYVVVGIDVAGETEAIDLGDGRLAPKSPGLAHASDETIALRSRDLRFVLSRLGTLRGAGRLDRSRVGAFGHSNGGATAATAMLADRRLRAGVDMDGAIFGSVVKRGLDRPFGVMQGNGPAAAYASLTEFRTHLRGPHPYAQYPGTMHHSFTDNVWLVPQVGLDPAASDVGTVDPGRAVAQQNTFLRRFFDRQIKG